MKLAKVITISVALFLFFASNAFAVCDPACGASEMCLGNTCVENPVSAPGSKVAQPASGILGFWVSRVFLFTLPIVGIIAFLFFLWTGFQMLMSKGDPKALDAAKARLTYTIIGMIIVFMAWALLQYFRGIFGLGPSSNLPPNATPRPPGAPF